MGIWLPTYSRGSMPFACTVCGCNSIWLVLQWEWLQILLFKHGEILETRYLVRQYNKALINSCNYMSYKGIHKRERDHECSQCGKAFVYIKNPLRHVMIHTGEKPGKKHVYTTIVTSLLDIPIELEQSKLSGYKTLIIILLTK